MDMIDLSNWNILAVDDEPDSLEVLCEVLSMHGANVHPAEGGRAALLLLEKIKPSLIVTDLSMPGVDGYQLLFKIRGFDHLKRTPVIALTAHAMKGDRELILSAGFTGYVSKPLRMATLAADILAQIPKPAQPAPVEPPHQVMLAADILAQIPKQAEPAPIEPSREVTQPNTLQPQS